MLVLVFISKSTTAMTETKRMIIKCKAEMACFWDTIVDCTDNNENNRIRSFLHQILIIITLIHIKCYVDKPMDDPQLKEEEKCARVHKQHEHVNEPIHWIYDRMKEMMRSVTITHLASAARCRTYPIVVVFFWMIYNCICVAYCIKHSSAHVCFVSCNIFCLLLKLSLSLSLSLYSRILLPPADFFIRTLCVRSFI